MRLIDEEGNLFGRVNVIDALFLLLATAVVVSGLLFVSSGDTGGGTVNRIIEVRVVDERFVIDAIEPGAVPDEDVVRVESIELRPAIDVNGTGELLDPAVADVSIVVRTTTDDLGASRFRGSRLYVGREVQLDLGTTVVEGKVVAVHEPPEVTA